MAAKRSSPSGKWRGLEKLTRDRKFWRKLFICENRCYSARNAVAGSILDARSAGRKTEITSVIESTVSEMIHEAESAAVTPKSSDPSTRPLAQARISPKKAPDTTQAPVSESTSRTIDLGVAPRAMRTPMSRVLWV